MFTELKNGLIKLDVYRFFLTKRISECLRSFKEVLRTWIGFTKLPYFGFTKWLQNLNAVTKQLNDDLFDFEV